MKIFLVKVGATPVETGIKLPWEVVVKAPDVQSALSKFTARYGVLDLQAVDSICCVASPKDMIE